jgi:hypothetical protein
VTNIINYSLYYYIYNYPPRPGRPPEGEMDSLALSRDIISAGQLPRDHPRPVAVTTPVHHRHPADHPLTWVAPSHFFPNGGLGLFFESPHPYGLKAGTLIAAYYGKDNRSEGRTAKHYKAAVKEWGGDDYAAADSYVKYIVVASPHCMGGRANDGFDRVNLLLRFHNMGNTESRMELVLLGPTPPGTVYEGLVNYDSPHAPSSYWDATRRSRLDPEDLARCLEYYPLQRMSAKLPISNKQKISKTLQNSIPTNSHSRPTKQETRTELYVVAGASESVKQNGAIEEF